MVDRRHAAQVLVLVPALLVLAGCGGNRSDRLLPPAEPASVRASTPAPADSSSTGAGRAPAPATDTDRQRRGNTPPGMDRSGGGPADGAIKDPTGAATGTPDRR